MKRLFIILTLCGVALPVAAAPPTPPLSVPNVVAGRLTADSTLPTIDGRVDEAIWQTVEP